MEQRKVFGDRFVALDLMKEMTLDEALVEWSFKVMEQERPPTVSTRDYVHKF